MFTIVRVEHDHQLRAGDQEQDQRRGGRRAASRRWRVGVGRLLVPRSIESQSRDVSVRYRCFGLRISAESYTFTARDRSYRVP